MAHISRVILNIWLIISFILMIIILCLLVYNKRIMLLDEDMYNLPSCSATGMVNTHIGVVIFLMLIPIFGILALRRKHRPLQIFVMVILCIAAVCSLGMVVFVAFAIPEADWYHTWLRVDQKHEPWTQVYSPLLRMTVVNPIAWSIVVNCLNKNKLCDKFNENTNITNLMFLGDVFLIVNCCSPPDRCHLEKDKRSNLWKPKIWMVHPLADKECQDWMEKASGKCYGCEKCKPSYLAGFHLAFEQNYAYEGFFAIFAYGTLLIIAFGAFEEPQKSHQGYVRVT